jgi:hypothetical protein
MEILLLPIELLMKLVQMSAHGIAALVNGAKGKNDGTALAGDQKPFHYTDSASLFRELVTLDRAGKRVVNTPGPGTSGYDVCTDPGLDAMATPRATGVRTI